MYLINPKFQLSFLGWILAMALGTIVLFYAAKVTFFIEVRHHLVTLGIPADHLVFDFLARQSHWMDLLFLGTAALETAFLGFIGLKLSHRVAGPLYRLRQHMLEISRGGALREVRFRKGDFFLEIAEAYNLHLPKLKPHADPSAEQKSA